MLLRAGASLAALALAFSGCLGANGPGGDDAVTRAAGDLLAPAAEPLWPVWQYYPHPAFNYPTLTNPAVGENVPPWWLPIEPRALPSPVAGLEHLAKSPDDVSSGAGMAVFGRLAIVPGYTANTSVLDITDPANPALLSRIEERHRNVDTIAYPDGRLVGVFTNRSVPGTLTVWDLTDPTAPVKLSEMEPASGIHKVNVVPGTPLVYNANSDGGDTRVPLPLPVPAPSPLVPSSVSLPTGQTEQTAVGQTEIYDLTDPENPVLVQEWKNGFGCHHIYFWINPPQDKYRAICAGIEYTQLWDIADPRNPEVIVSIPVHHGVAGTPSASSGTTAFSHFAILNDDGTVLVTGDEMGGGGLPPGCVARADTPAGERSTPFGAIWFYDVSDERNPRLLGWFSPGLPTQNLPEPRAPEPSPGGVFGSFFSCTAHHGRLVPDPERDLLAMAFYWAGVVLVDFTDPSNPRMLDQWNDGADTWEVQYYNGYLFTGDLRRGMDVLTLR